jgi:uncharacterized protein
MQNRLSRESAHSGIVFTLLIAIMVLPAPGCALAGQVRIHDIQGNTRLSPLDGQSVSGVPGIVTGVRDYGSSQGFWFQDAHPDNDPATSEGIFVSTRRVSPTVDIGDSVTVDAKVQEYYPAGTDSSGQSVTELVDATVHVVSKGNAVPAPVVLDASDVPQAYVPAAPQPGQSIESLRLEPKQYALDLYESLEGMNVEVDNAHVVGPTDKYHELWVTTKPNENPTQRGGTIYCGYDQPNGGRLQVQTLIPMAREAFPDANVGDYFVGPICGPMDYNRYGGYTIMANTMGTLKSGGIKPQMVGKAGSEDELSLATYNVENLSPVDSDAKFARLGKGIVVNLGSPDIVALEEIQDNDGPKDDGVVAADQTMRKFIAAIKAAGGPAYDWRGIDPQDKADGGQPGGNIRQVLMFNPARVTFTDIPGGDATTAVEITTENGKVGLTLSPGRIAPSEAAWNACRKALAAQFVFGGRTVFVIADHFKSKFGDQDLDSRFQPPAHISEVKRRAQSVSEHDFVRKLLAADPKALVVVLGDLNDYPFSPALKPLTEDGLLRDLITTLPVNQQYSYVFHGNSQALDHILVSPAVHVSDYMVVHINSEFAHQTSDHEPQVLRMRP